MSESKPTVLAETREWVVVNKPAGWLSIVGRGDPDPILLDWVRLQFPDVQVVHRLDRETSGVILFARGPEAHRKASLWFQDRQTKKQYCCLAVGTAGQPFLKINLPIEKMASVTQIEVKESFHGAFFASVRPLTGRRHQIRIHLASAGHPILGDSLYGGPQNLLLSDGKSLSFARFALHAQSLELPSGEKFEAPIPPDFKTWLEELRSDKK